MQPEVRYRDSRLDFRYEKDGRTYYLEVKGCTLVRDGVGWFPDAPTERGVRHLRELTRAAQEGLGAVLAFVIQTEGVTEVRPNDRTQPAFGAALREAQAAGVQVLALPCRVRPDALTIADVPLP